MSSQNIDQSQNINNIITALQTCLTNYPTYNILTQFQNSLRAELLKTQKNSILHKGQKYFSQNEEDGITLEILRRMDLLNTSTQKNFIEFGVGNGLENNSLILLMHGYKGVWIGNENLAINIEKSKRLHYIKTWLTLENMNEVFSNCINYLNSLNIDVLSMDLDGNDIYFINFFLLSNCLPKVIIAEYNAKFPPPVEFTIDYDGNHNFNSDYMGASLQSLVNLLSAQYTLVACNITGSNSFFIRNDFKDKFSDIPTDINELFMPANYGIVTKVGHPVSPRTVENFIK